MNEVVFSVLIPFLGTVLGSAFIFIFKKMNDSVLQGFTGFAAGVMIAASVWSLIIPAIEVSSDKGTFAVIPALIGIWIGFIFFMILDKVIPHLHSGSEECEGPKCNLNKSIMTSLAVGLHNLPEGIAVGVVIASAQVSNSAVTIGVAIVLAIGIAVQNFPEGAIVSVSLNNSGVSKGKAFGIGVLTGAVEPIGALVTILFAKILNPGLPYLLTFAAGAMLFVVVEELIPDMVKEKHSHIGTIFFAIGFSLMMVLDVLLG